MFAWGEDRQELCAGSAYLQLAARHADALDRPALGRLLTKATHHAERALTLLQSVAPDKRSETIESSVRVDLAGAHLLRGDLDGAQHNLTTILALPSDRRTQRVLRRLDDLRGRLADPRYAVSGQARRLNEQLLDFTATAAVRALPAGG